MKFCTNCGNQLSAKQKYCTNCGKPITEEKKPVDLEKNEAKQENRVDPPTEKTLQAHEDVDLVTETPKPVSMKTEEEPKSRAGKEMKENKKIPKWLYGVVAALVLVIGGVFIFLQNDAEEAVTVDQPVEAETAVEDKEVKKAEDSPPPAISATDVDELFPGWELAVDEVIHVADSYYTIVAVGHQESEFEAFAKLAVVDYEAEKEQWEITWETEEYYAEPMVGIDDYFGDFLVVNPEEEEVSLGVFNIMHMGNSGVYETVAVEVDKEGSGITKWEGYASHFEQENDGIVIYDLGEVHLSASDGEVVVEERSRSEVGSADVYQATFTIDQYGEVIATDSKEIYLDLGQSLSFIPADEQAKASFDEGEIRIYTNLWNGGSADTSNANLLPRGNVVEFTEEGTFEFILAIDNPTLTFIVYVGQEEKEALEEEEESDQQSGIVAPFPMGTPLADLIDHYGDPTYNDYYNGGWLVIFNDEEGYYIDELDETVRGYRFGNQSISVYNGKVGMTGEEIDQAIGIESESHFNEVDGIGYLRFYYIDDYKIIFESEEEDGAMIVVSVVFEG